MKTIFTFVIAFACFTASAATSITWFRFDNKDYYPGESIRLMFQISGTYNATTPIVFTLKTGPALGTTLTKNVALGTLQTTTWNSFTFYYYDWALDCNTTTANNAEVSVNYTSTSPLLTNIKPTDASHPCSVSPPITSSIASPMESQYECSFNVYDVTGVLLKTFNGLYKDMHLGAGFYIIQVNGSDSFKVRVQ